jgi:hypothetical protein
VKTMRIPEYTGITTMRNDPNGRGIIVVESRPVQQGFYANYNSNLRVVACLPSGKTSCFSGNGRAV